MPVHQIDRTIREQLLDRICKGVIEGIRQEVDRRRRMGIPLVVARNGHVESMMPEAKGELGSQDSPV